MNNQEITTILRNAATNFLWIIKRVAIALFKQFQAVQRPIRYGIIILLIYLVTYPWLTRSLGLQEGIATIPLLLLMAVLNKTLWILLFLFWFGWNLFAILRSFNATWNRSIKSNYACEKDSEDIAKDSRVNSKFCVDTFVLLVVGAAFFIGFSLGKYDAYKNDRYELTSLGTVDEEWPPAKKL